MFLQLGLVTAPDRHARHLPGRHPLPRRRHHRHRPPLVLHRPGDAQHGPGGVLLGPGGRAADPADARRLGLHPAARAAVRRCGQATFADRHKWAIYFLMAVGFWNFVGAGIFGFLINLPIVSYFEVGTTLTTQPRPRRDVRRLRHAGAGGPRLLPARRSPTTPPGRATERFDPGRLLGPQRRPRAHDGARPLPGRRAAALGRPPERLLARAAAHLPDERDLPHARVGARRRRRGVPGGRRRAAGRSPWRSCSSARAGAREPPCDFREAPSAGASAGVARSARRCSASKSSATGC